MKKRSILGLLMIALCAAVFLGYRAVDRFHTDMAAPEIHIDPQLLELSVEDPWELLLQGVTAADNRDGDVTESLIVEQVRLLDADSGKISVSIAAFDAAGNIAKAEREAYYTDYASPKFSLTGDLVFEQGSSVDVLTCIQAHDMLDGTITHRIRVTSLEAPAAGSIGNRRVRFKVFNSLGDTVELVLPVTVVENGLYNADLALTSYLVYLDKGASFDAGDYLGEFRIGTEQVSLRGGLPAGFTLKTTGNVNTREPGVYTIAYKVTYVSSDSVSFGYDRSYVGYAELNVVVEG